MTTILFAFILALFLSLCFTPLARVIGIRLGAMDLPGRRKMHSMPIPRIGGVGIFVSFVITITIFGSFIETTTSQLLILDTRSLALLTGAAICFLTGLVDDFHSLPAGVKCLFQILAATLVYYGGLSIDKLFIGIGNLELGFFGLPLTVLWFLVFINAINLIDGLDGLAGGITFIAALLMVMLSIMADNYLIALLFVVLAGSIMGFLYYNFNPASIFLGDGGSYFLGFAFAGLSLYGSMKSQMGSVMLIPILALGVPLFDVTVSSLRRFLEGQKIFGPDKDHIHHRLVGFGLSARRVVLLMYGISIGLCMISLLLVHVRDERVAVILLLLAVGAVIFVRKLGYFDYVGYRQIYFWMKDLKEEAGFSRERRSFLSQLSQISRTHSLEQLWEKMGQIFALLEFDQSMLYLNPGWTSGSFCQKDTTTSPACCSHENNNCRRVIVLEMSSICLREAPPDFKWCRQDFKAFNGTGSRFLYRLELPLTDTREHQVYGTLVLIKDCQQGTISHYSLKRIEHLRRAVVNKMAVLARSVAYTHQKLPPTKV